MQMVSINFLKLEDKDIIFAWKCCCLHSCLVTSLQSWNGSFTHFSLSTHTNFCWGTSLHDWTGIWSHFFTLCFSFRNFWTLTQFVLGKYLQVSGRSAQIFCEPYEQKIRLRKGKWHLMVPNSIARIAYSLSWSFLPSDVVFEVFWPNLTAHLQNELSKDITISQCALSLLLDIQAKPKESFLQKLLKWWELTEDKKHDRILWGRNRCEWFENKVYKLKAALLIVWLNPKPLVS